MRYALGILILAAVSGASAAVEAWLDQRGFDRLSAALLGTVAAGLTILLIALVLYFGRLL